MWFYMYIESGVFPKYIRPKANTESTVTLVGVQNKNERVDKTVQ